MTFDVETSMPAPPDYYVAAACGLCGAPPGRPFLEKAGGYYTHCQACGFVYANPRNPKPEEYNRESNESGFERYVKKHYSREKQRVFKRQLKLFEPFRKTNRILEIGSSAGGFLYCAKANGWSPTGIEPVEQAANHAIQKYGADVRIGVLEEADLPSDHFDAIFSNAVFEHLPNPSEVTREAFRVLRPGGVLFVDTVNIGSFTWENLGKEWKLVDARGHLCLYTPDTLKKLMENSGFRVREISSHGVRFRPNRSARLTGLSWLLEEIKKTPYSLLARYTLKGDSIAVIAEKPDKNPSRLARGLPEMDS